MTATPVIWHGGPPTKVFIDSRYDLAYPPSVIADFLALDRGYPGTAHTLAIYPTDFVLTAPGRPEANVMDSQPDWRLIYSDDVSSIYARADSPAAISTASRCKALYFLQSSLTQLVQSKQD
jgi:hypothetical protein